jgi:dihydrofolate reductase
MTISLIAAVAKNGVIGNAGKIPWHLPNDMRHFREITLNHPVIMGRKTYESIGKPLPGRNNIIVTRQEDYGAPECTVVHTLEDALKAARQEGAEEAFVIGGSELYREAMPVADRLYITAIGENFEGDALFPEINSFEWKKISEEKGTVDEKNRHPHAFLIFERKKKGN